MNQSTHIVSGVTLDPHPIIKQAGMRRCATSNAAGPRPRVVYVSECEQRVHTQGYQPLWASQSTHMVSSIILDPHPIIKEAGIMEHATSNAARLRRNTRLRVHLSGCERWVHTRGYRPQWVNHSIILVSSILLDPHPIIKEAGITEHTTSKSARLRRNTRLRIHLSGCE